MLALSRQMARETHCALQGQHISRKVGPPVDFCHNPLRNGREWTKSKCFFFFSFKLKRGKKFYFTLHLFHQQ